MIAQTQFVTRLILRVRCCWCDSITELLVDPREFHDWQSGETIPVAFPTLPVEDREMLQTGLCPNCQVSVGGDK